MTEAASEQGYGKAMNGPIQIGHQTVSGGATGAAGGVGIGLLTGAPVAGALKSIARIS